MPSGKSTDGYTKAAQKQKFVRHRDVKMKDSELKKEAKIQKLMSEGVCKRCREKVQWKFRYDKYKSLKNPATCQECKQKTVTKAYRTLCDRCASAKNICPGCCQDPKDPEQGDELVSSKTESVPTKEGGKQELSMDVEDDEQDEDEDTSSVPKAEDEGEEEMDEVNVQDVNWHEKKFNNIAASKYSKNRTTGNEQTY
jgi:hypothetical protein